MDAIFLFAQLARWSTFYGLLEKDPRVPKRARGIFMLWIRLRFSRCQPRRTEYSGQDGELGVFLLYEIGAGSLL